MLLQNITILASIPSTFRGGTLANERSQFGFRADTNLNKYAGEAGISSKSAVPNGYSPGYAYFQERVTGGMALYNGMLGTGTITFGNLAGGRNAQATINGLGEIVNAQGSLIMQAVATILASGSITNANLLGTLYAAATLAGVGDITGSLGALADAIAVLLGEGSINAGINAYAFMSATIYVNTSTATTKELAAEVWNSLVTDFNAPGTMGEAVGAAGTAGDPWTTTLPGSYTGDQAGNIVGKKVLTVGKFEALK